MKIHREKIKIAMARACMNTADLQRAAKMPRPTLDGAISGHNVSPKTAGMIARALHVNVEDILEVTM